MTNINEFIKAKEELAQEIQDYYFDRGARLTAQDWKWIKEKISQSLLEYNEKIKETCNIKKRVILDKIDAGDNKYWKSNRNHDMGYNKALDDIITNLTIKE